MEATIKTMKFVCRHGLAFTLTFVALSAAIASVVCHRMGL